MCACVSLILCKLKIYFLCFLIFLSDACCLRELRSDAMMFMNGLVKHITTVAVVQQCGSSNLLKQP